VIITNSISETKRTQQSHNKFRDILICSDINIENYKSQSVVNDWLNWITFTSGK
jgi:hypothetical protein